MFTDCCIPIRLGDGDTYPTPGTRCRGNPRCPREGCHGEIKANWKKKE